MFAEVHIPETLSPRELDQYLERGWFRMGQTIFTTNFLQVKTEIYSTIWLRVLLNNYVPDTTQVKLFKKNSSLKTIIRTAEVTQEKENLYSLYKGSVPFQASHSLHQLMYSGKADTSSIYQTYEVAVYDGAELVACGYFDVGERSAEGISSFYNPSYKKYSLGKYMIYKKMEFCQDLRLQYFYPGYFVPGNSHFDYKLTIGKPALEYLELSSMQWLHINNFTGQQIPFDVMLGKLESLNANLHNRSINSRIMKYEYFDVNLMPQFRDLGLFDHPVFLFFGTEGAASIVPLIIFDVADNFYHMLACVPDWKPNEINPDTNFYSSYFLNSAYEIFVTADENEIAEFVAKTFKAYI